MASHCLPTGSLGSNQLPVPPINAVTCPTSLATVSPKRGVVVVGHGLQPAMIVPPVPIEAADTVGGFFPSYIHSFVVWLNGMGWHVIQPPYPEDYYALEPVKGMEADIEDATGGNGSRLKATNALWWDHVVAHIRRTYGEWPIVPFGVSWGGWMMSNAVAARPSTITAYMLHLPVTILSNLPTSITGRATFTSTFGLDSSPHLLDAVTKPGIIGYSTNDAFVGWGTPGQGTCPTEPGYGGLPISNTDLIIVNAQAAGRPVTRLNEGNVGHSTPVSVINSLESWMSSTVHPLCPAVY